MSGPNGEAKTRHHLFRTWASMHQRCSNPNLKCFKSYGGKGVKVCDRWKSFWNFVDDLPKRPTAKHSLDRIDSNGNYEPTNVRWATQKEQLRNNSRTFFVTHEGDTKCLTDWSEVVGISMPTLRARIKIFGWTAEKALTTPVRTYGGIRRN